MKISEVESNLNAAYKGNQGIIIVLKDGCELRGILCSRPEGSIWRIVLLQSKIGGAIATEEISFDTKDVISISTT
jgi:hypothetical protein